MKLEDFVNEVIINERAKEKYHVISTCEFCKWWHKELQCTSGDCYDDLSLSVSEYHETSKDFGCIHWSEKK